jgi:precorrin-8X/cobalt-precorrin-8 methylmutase
VTMPDPLSPGDPPHGDGTDEEESYRILRSRLDLSRLPRFSRDVTERVIHASADFDYFTDLACDEEALAAGVDVLAAGAPVVADSAMVAAGLADCPATAGFPVICKVGEPLTIRLARTAAISPAAAAVRLAFGEAGPGAVWIVGGSGAALQEVLSRGVEPAFVVGLPAGFVGAAEAKDALRASGYRCITNISEKGGAAVAVAAFAALLSAALASAEPATQAAAPGRDSGEQTSTARAGWNPDLPSDLLDDRRVADSG